MEAQLTDEILFQIVDALGVTLTWGPERKISMSGELPIVLFGVPMPVRITTLSSYVSDYGSFAVLYSGGEELTFYTDVSARDNFRRIRFAVVDPSRLDHGGVDLFEAANCDRVSDARSLVNPHVVKRLELDRQAKPKAWTSVDAWS